MLSSKYLYDIRFTFTFLFSRMILFSLDSFSNFNAFLWNKTFVYLLLLNNTFPRKG